MISLDIDHPFKQSLAIKRHSKTVIVGQNGSGKTTLLQKMLHTLDAPYTGYCPDSVPLYPQLTLSQYIEFVASIRKLPAKRGDVLLSFFTLDPYRHHRLSDLSKGYKQLVNIVQSCLGDPDILLMDEPMSHLDPEHILLLIDWLKGFKGTLVFSTHQFDVISPIVTDIIVVKSLHIARHQSLQDASILDIYMACQ